MDKSYKSDDSIIDDTFQILNERHNNIYRFVMRYNDYIVSTHNYGGDIPLTMIEAHTLTYIEENPGTTIGDLSKYWNKTKGAISQTVSRLTEKGLVTKDKIDGNSKNIFLYPTKLGIKLSKSHKLYDTLDIAKTMGKLQKECSADEIDAFYKVISVYNKIIQNDFEINKNK